MTMSLLDDTMTEKLVTGATRAYDVAKGSLEEKAARAESRLRSEAKTRKSAATREKIMAAATQIMVERGTTDFQMSEVSARCNMSKGSLYYYFSDRSALVRAVFDRAVDDLVSDVEGAVARASSAKESIVNLMAALAEALEPTSPLTLAITHHNDSLDVLPDTGTRLTRITSILAAQFERAKGEGLVRPEVDSKLGAATIAGAFMVYECALPHDGSQSDAEDVNALLDLVFSGVGTERARSLFSVSAEPGELEASASEAA